MTSQTVRQRHPIRALLWGLLIGISVAIYLTLVFPVIVLDTVSSAAIKMALVAVGVAVVMMVITMYLIPPKQPKGSRPGRSQSGHQASSVVGEADTATTGADGVQGQSATPLAEDSDDQPSSDDGSEAGSDPKEPGYPS
ncbi:MAG: hypothetical protein OES13_00125 [Acidimicrobiia bacterium]|nr:hypothetical protein [Acidimicrobiia bacterium]